jgi:hypothetical protein
VKLKKGNQMDNVVPFPKSNKQLNNPTSIDEIIEKLNDVKDLHINETLEVVIPMLFNYLETAGFGFGEIDEEDTQDPHLKDAAFVVEGVRSLLCKYYGLSHPFHQISENIFVEDLVNEGTFRLVKNLNIEFRNVEKGNSETL